MGISCSVVRSRNIDLSKFTFSHTIGEGGSANVHCVKYIPDESLLVLKEVSIKGSLQRSADALDGVCGELSLLKAVGFHPFIVELQFAFHDSVSCYLGLEYLKGGDLRHHMLNSVPFTERRVAFLVACIGSALHHMHCHKFIHRDVKPENIILDSRGYPRLIDFDIAYYTGNEQNGGAVCCKRSGTKPYMSPESLASSRRHSYPTDMWSLGVVAFELLFKRKPFEKHVPLKYIEYIEATYSDSWWERAAKEVRRHRGSEASISPVSVSRSASCSPPISRRKSIPLTPKISSGLPPPSHLIPPLPRNTSTGECLTPEAADMIKGLLDVRIPVRLGAGDTYEAFRNHPWLRKNDCRVDSSLLFKRGKAPYVPPTEGIYSASGKQGKRGHYSLTSSSRNAKERFETACKIASSPARRRRQHSGGFTKEVEAKLQRYYFQPINRIARRPSDLSLADRTSHVLTEDT
mmetsp:Transcript_22649/g.33109  ORF Transcript_22649/g.33109 Transcript_22649/m.33109 type:complete len:462 (-) Transcript_22649:444-1829(-)|eukprot:CAMPEP_0185028300 /NCGR_PEP_ID=MMETSP1103-20130426/13945_1 /TAXON_ID=36769 /ORGANISM="Paraphysomonas bandaiensis, Strain Caron Lab Isolate" /LENGTH=461 /DNA_ID=CAMNT_0027562675 /DNA_START=95 /DNA_END=1480 /DNA_ORIENTATION=+